MKLDKSATLATEEPKVAILGSEKAPAGAPTHTLYFRYIGNLYRGKILRSEQPSGVVLGPSREDRRRYHRLGSCREGISLDFYTCWAMSGDTLETLFGRVGATFSIFGMSWDVSGSGLGTFLDRFGKVLRKMSDRVEK